ncbi:MAG: class D beta-lactamase [Terrimicrobiaceae bacterium]
MLLPLLALASALALPQVTISDAFGKNVGAFPVVDCTTGARTESDPVACSETAAPCSSFKIWNAAIGLETGVVTDPDALFWKWDGKKRFLESWNTDQTLRSAMKASCVPAFQQMARDIGQPRMNKWIEKLGYGNRDTASGLDVFWLPAEGRRSILISANDQAELIARLLTGHLPVSKRNRAILRDILKVGELPTGTLYGKTGTGTAPDGSDIGWFVGRLETRKNILAFACKLSGPDASGKTARAAAEKILSSLPPR